MSYEAWPSPNARRGPLPRIEDLPVAEQGYDQEAVRRAFDDFYRHAAQLDAALKTLEAVEAFQRDAALLRADLRSLHSLGPDGGVRTDWSTHTWTTGRARPELPVTALRLAAEAALLIAVAVVAGVAHLRGSVIVALMAAAVVVVWISEWLAARARTRVVASVYDPIGVAAVPVAPPAAPAGEPAPFVETPVLEPAVGWSAFEVAPAEEEDEPEALTGIEEPLEDTEEDAGPEQEDEDENENEDEREPEPAAAEEPQRRGWLRRRALAPGAEQD